MSSGKSALRRLLRDRLASLPLETAEGASMEILRRLQEWDAFQLARTVALFHPTVTEPRLLPLLAAAPEKVFVYPVCHPDRSLTWHPDPHPDGPGGEAWTTSPFGIREPDPVRLPAVPSGEIDLVIVPGLGFTETGLRLGHGAGYYDRFLATLAPDIPTTGVCFSCQILPDLPSEPHDIRVGRVIHG